MMGHVLRVLLYVLLALGVVWVFWVYSYWATP